MRVGITAEFLGQKLNGGATYQRDLLRGLAHLDGGRCHVYPYISTERARALVPAAPHITPRLVAPYSALIRLSVTLPAELLRRPVDLLHAASGWGPPWSSVPMVASIHDLSWERNPEIVSAPLRWRLAVLVRLTAHRAVRIITLSQHSADDLRHFYRVPAQKLRVVSPPFDPQPFVEAATSEEVARVSGCYGLTDQPYILYVGSIEPRKNVDKLIRAYAQLRKAGRIPHHLVVAGKALRLFRPTLELPAALGIERDVRFIGQVPQADLPGLYAGAAVFGFLGSSEGWGYPPLEAMACGTPVLVANKTSLPEVVGDAAVLTDPFQHDQVVGGLERLVTDEDLRARLCARGRERVHSFAPATTAHQVVAVYEEALAEARRRHWIPSRAGREKTLEAAGRPKPL